MNLTGKRIVITGAASGIGRMLALESGRRGASVVMTDFNEQGLSETAKLFAQEQPNGSCEQHTLNVSSLQNWREVKAAILANENHIDGIINNAGIAFAGSIEDTSFEELDRVMDINFKGMVYGTKEFLREIKSRPESFIANVSSVFGLYGMKNNSAYCASKFAIRGFTETLIQELRHTNVTVSSIHPGHIGTNIVKNALDSGNILGAESISEEEQTNHGDRFRDNGLSPEEAAVIILNGIEQGSRRILVGEDAVQADEYVRQSPESFSDAANDGAG